MRSIFVIIPIILFVVIGSGSALYFSSYDDNVINLDMGRQVGDVNTSLGSPLLGSTSAPVTIIEFGDYQCPKCKEWFLNTKPDIVTNYIDTGKANLIFVDIAFLGKDSMPAARATYCAEEQGRYWDYHAFLYTNQMGIDNGWANIDSQKAYASNLGFDMDLFVGCMDSGKYEKRVQFNTEESQKNGVTGTPTFIIVGPQGQQERILGPQPFAVFEKIIDSML
ncbi:MAG: DsbA family protein [Thaumarchaeota archaeon]|nr:DsbA family protein [Nitrososphaerota archaeon]